MIGATIADGWSPDNLRAALILALSQELLEPLPQDRLRESAEDAVLKIGARRPIGAPDAEVHTRQPVPAVGEGRAHLLRRAPDRGLGHEQRELVRELTGPELDLALAEDSHVARDEADDRRAQDVA